MNRNALLLVAAVVVIGAALIGREVYVGRVEERSRKLEQMIRNDARQLGASASQYLLEHREARSVSFAVDSKGEVTGPLHQWCSRLTRGVRVLDGKIDGPADTFSLQHDEAFGGRPVVFTCDGRLRK
jgi:hypothetical protein